MRFFFFYIKFHVCIHIQRVILYTYCTYMYNILYIYLSLYYSGRRGEYNCSADRLDDDQSRCNYPRVMVWRVSVVRIISTCFSCRPIDRYRGNENRRQTHYTNIHLQTIL